MTYAEALGYLEGLGRFGLRPGLDTVRFLASRFGDPHRDLRFIHVAGTNGKGSTCAFLDAMCREAGLRVGLYTSPHLVSFRERIQVNGEWVPAAWVAEWVEGMGRVLEEAGSCEQAHPTFFELVTVMALVWFQRQACDVVVWETGLGGRLDATNLVTPTVSAVTNIGWDHMEWLGNTLEAIAREKAGIFKPGVPAVTTERRPETLAVLREEAGRRGTGLTEVGPEGEAWRFCQGTPLALPGQHQRANAALALAALSAGGWDGRVPWEARRRGLAGARWPGRFQVVEHQGRTLVLDGAHNVPGFEVLAAAMAEAFPGRKYGLVVGLLADKEPGSGLVGLVRGASQVMVVRVASERAGDPAGLARWVASMAPEVPVRVGETLEAGLGGLSDEGLVLVTGSLYLIGETLGLLGAGRENERRLNDWSRTR